MAVSALTVSREAGRVERETCRSHTVGQLSPCRVGQVRSDGKWIREAGSALTGRVGAGGRARGKKLQSPWSGAATALSRQPRSLSEAEVRGEGEREREGVR